MVIFERVSLVKAQYLPVTRTKVSWPIAGAVRRLAYGLVRSNLRLLVRNKEIGFVGICPLIKRKIHRVRGSPSLLCNSKSLRPRLSRNSLSSIG